MPYLNIDDGMDEHEKIDALSDAAYRLLIRDVCKWGRTGRTDSALVAELIEGKSVRRAPRHSIPSRLLAPIARYRRKIPIQIRTRIYARDGHKCVHCGTENGLTLDHIVPWSAGGSDDESNLQTLCQSCNSRKGARV